MNHNDLLRLVARSLKFCPPQLLPNSSSVSYLTNAYVTDENEIVIRLSFDDDLGDGEIEEYTITLK